MVVLGGEEAEAFVTFLLTLSAFLVTEVEAFLTVETLFLGSLTLFLLTTETLRRGGLPTAGASFLVAFLTAASFFVLAFSSRRLRGLVSAFLSLVCV